MNVSFMEGQPAPLTHLCSPEDITECCSVVICRIGAERVLGDWMEKTIHDWVGGLVDG